MTDLEWLNNFSNNLSALMREANMSRTELAAAADISVSTISKYLNGGQAPSYRALVNIAYALDCDINELADFGDMIR